MRLVREDVFKSTHNFIQTDRSTVVDANHRPSASRTRRALGRRQEGFVDSTAENAEEDDVNGHAAS